MTAATVTSKGQITIPAPIRAALGVESGDRVEFVETEPGHYEVIAATLPVTALKGLVAKADEPVDIENMNAAVRRRAGKAMEP